MESSFVHVARENSVFKINSETLGGIKVRRDMEVVRKILREIQDKTNRTP